MSTITINRGDTTRIPFTITDAANGLMGKRVTWSVENSRQAVILAKAGALPGSSADITVNTQVPGEISGTINMLVADYAILRADSYPCTLWIDDGAGNQKPVTPGGKDTLVIVETVARG